MACITASLPLVDDNKFDAFTKELGREGLHAYLAELEKAHRVIEDEKRAKRLAFLDEIVNFDRSELNTERELGEHTLMTVLNKYFDNKPTTVNPDGWFDDTEKQLEYHHSCEISTEEDAKVTISFFTKYGNLSFNDVRIIGYAGYYLTASNVTCGGSLIVENFSMSNTHVEKMINECENY